MFTVSVNGALDYLIKHVLEWLIELLKLAIKCQENAGLKSPKSMLINTRYPNFLHGSDFLCFLTLNY